MKMNFSLLLLLVIVAIGGVSASGQCKPETILEERFRSSPISDINFAELELFLDFALLIADKCESNLIAIVKMEKNTSVSLSKLRMRRVASYIRFRGFKNFEVATSFDGGARGKIELYVAGKLLYTLPLKKKDKLRPPGI